ncbi:MAG: hypothetical protein ACYSR0_07075 [Planctomycetota bacterium]|jgi:hypothetical protein
MKNLLNCSSLIRAAVIIVVMAFMASQVTDAYAGGWMDRLVDKIRVALQGDFDEIREEIANHTHDGGGGGGGGDGDDCGCPGDILPAGGRTIGGPHIETIQAGAEHEIYEPNMSGTQRLCITVQNLSTSNLTLEYPTTGTALQILVRSGRAKTICTELNSGLSTSRFKLINNTSSAITAAWRIDTYDNL